MIILENLTISKIGFCFEFFLKSPVSRIVPRNLKGGPFGIFKDPICYKISKNEGEPVGDIKLFEEKKKRILKSLIVPKNVKRGDPLGSIDNHSVAKFYNFEGGPFGASKKFSKKDSLRRNKSTIKAPR